MTVTIRPIEKRDNNVIKEIIVQVMTEFGAVGPGFSIEDSELSDMYESYKEPRSCYFVCEEDGIVKGGAGIAPLQGSEKDTGELRKMYFLPELRGRGIGVMLMKKCLKFAQDESFSQCYIESLASMTAAEKLYKAFGFEHISNPLGNTGHHKCDRYLARSL